MVPVKLPFTEDETFAVKVTDIPAAEGLALEARVVTVAAELTICAKLAELLARKLESPLYFAVIECEPAVRAVAEVAKVAAPPERLALLAFEAWGVSPFSHTSLLLQPQVSDCRVFRAESEAAYR
jgi:hypothetical protein